ncbi:MAG: hypothetical protein PHX79_06960, partial [Sphaerochaetaceae bacterium]|nr:hypothetical protein [Sphaerochaetaceae bacterium]
AYQTMQTKPKYTGRANCTSMYPQHASDNKSIFDRSNMVSWSLATRLPQGELMNIGKHGERLNAASYEGYMKKTNEKQGKARCK